MSKTIRGQSCSASVRNGKSGVTSCYSKEQLQAIAREYNRQYPDKISTTGTKEKLWSEIDKRMMRTCNDEMCWSKTFGLKYDVAFAPKGPSKRDGWLNTRQIHNVLKQYEVLYPDFVMMGPVPIDFCNIGHTLCSLDLKKAYRQGKRTLGVVFNTDPSTKPGKHWICLFVDMRHKDCRYWEINYFDSFGSSTLAKEVQRLIQSFDRQLTEMISSKTKLPIGRIKVIKKLNCSNDMCTVSIQHQNNDFDCGVYCIHFIEQRLHGVTWEELVTVNSIFLHDDNMRQLRKEYFRPNHW